MNRFLYAQANPWTFSDPSGHATCYGSSDLCDESMAIRHRGSQSGKDAVRRIRSRDNVDYSYARRLHAKSRVYETNPQSTPETAWAGKDTWGESTRIANASTAGTAAQTAQRQADAAATTAGIGDAFGDIWNSALHVSSCIGNILNCADVGAGLAMVVLNPMGTSFATAERRWAAIQSDEKRAGAHAITSTVIDFASILPLFSLLKGAAVSDAALAASSASEGADFIQALGLTSKVRPNAAAGFARDGRVLGGYSGSSMDQYNIVVRELLDRAPGGPGRFNGSCAEMQCLSNVYDAGINPGRGVMDVDQIRPPGDPTHGATLRACAVCDWVLDQVGVTH